MIDEISIRNFRGFTSLDAPFCRRINVIVGENGVGKTALLEAIYLALSQSPAQAWKLKTLRGFEGTVFQGTAAQINNAFVGDYFHDFDLTKAISVALKGSAYETRSVRIGRGTIEATLPLQQAGAQLPSASVPVEFTWTDQLGVSRTVTPRISAAGIQFEDTGEQRPEFYGFFSNQAIPASELAGRFSALSQMDLHHPFVKLISEEYPWISNVNIEVVAGSPLLYASLKNQKAKVPLNSVGGAVTRVFAMLISIIARESGVVIIDEIENGIYYKHYASVWRSILSLAREHQTQLFLTSHSGEALTALHEAASGFLKDIAFWRLERAADFSVGLKQFSGEDFAAAMEYNNEVR